MRSFILLLLITVVPAQANIIKEGPPLSECSAVDSVVVDFDGLIKELRNTKALSMFQKLHLKNHIDQLIRKFESYHSSAGKLTIEQLREQYHLLMIKVAVTVKNEDAELHRKVCNAWSEIWGGLKDPIEFKKLKGKAKHG